jgi:hypothetical protein
MGWVTFREVEFKLAFVTLDRDRAPDQELSRLHPVQHDGTSRSWTVPAGLVLA